MNRKLKMALCRLSLAVGLFAALSTPKPAFALTESCADYGNSTCCAYYEYTVYGWVYAGGLNWVTC